MYALESSDTVSSAIVKAVTAAREYGPTDRTFVFAQSWPMVPNGITLVLTRQNYFGSAENRYSVDCFKGKSEHYSGLAVDANGNIEVYLTASQPLSQ